MNGPRAGEGRVDGGDRRAIALHGAYHIDNFGDTLLLAIYASWIREIVPGTVVTMPYAAPPVRAAAGAVDGPSHTTPWTADAIVYGGGGYFGEPPGNPHRWGGRFLRRHPYLALSARSIGRPYAVIGVGFGPLSNRVARAAAVAVCNGARTLAVRDDESKAFAVQYGVSPDRIRVTADAAMSLTSKDLPPYAREYAESLKGGTNGSLTIGAHLSFSRHEEGGIGVVIDELERLLARHDDVSIVGILDRQGAKEQLESAEELRRRIGHRVKILPYEDTWRLAAALGQLDLVITTKLHVGIVSATLGTPVISLPVHSKVPRFYRQIGAMDRCHPLRDLGHGHLSELLEDWYRDPKRRMSIPSEIRQTARENKRLLREFLDRSVGPVHESGLRDDE